jgi:hypothetical protein
MTYTIYFPDGVEKTFDKIEDVRSELKVSFDTIYLIINNQCNFKHKNTIHLKGVIIRSAEVNNMIERELYCRQKDIISKAKLVKKKKLLRKIEYYKNMIEKYEAEIANARIRLKLLSNY